MLPYPVCPSGSCIKTSGLLELPFAPGVHGQPALADLSQMKKLKDVAFRCETLHVRWIIVALETITSEQRGFQQISINIPRYLVVAGDPASVRRTVGEETYGEWTDLDRLLVRFLESRAVRTKIVYGVEARGEKGQHGHIGGLLPEMTARGIIELCTPW